MLLDPVALLAVLLELDEELVELKLRMSSCRMVGIRELEVVVEAVAKQLVIPLRLEESVPEPFESTPMSKASSNKKTSMRG